MEHYVVSVTDEKELVFIDTTMAEAVYFMYKNRYPVNRLTYFLPWYMAWYEQTAIEDLNGYFPNVLIYNPDWVIWGVSEYLPAFRKNAEESYKQLSDSPSDGWKYYICMRKEAD